IGGRGRRGAAGGIGGAGHAPMVARSRVGVNRNAARVSPPPRSPAVKWREREQGHVRGMPGPAASIPAMRAWRARLACAMAGAWLALAGPACALDPELPPERYTITRWSADDGLPHSQIHDIGQSPDGFLWVTTWEGTVRFDGLTFSDVERLQQASGARPASRVLWRDGDGSMLVGVDGPGLLRVPAQGPARPACADLPALRVSQLADGGQDGPWMVTDEGLYRLQPD